jgi:hypothetical protein
MWDHYHGAVPSHHILARPDLPKISNWWGGVLLPLLTWFLLYRVQKRLSNNSSLKQHELSLPTNVLYGFAGAFIFGVLLSTFFTLGSSDIPGYMMSGVFLIALFFPIYRAECLLGYVIGMCYTFGVVLPTIAGSILALIGAVLYLFIRPVFLYITSSLIHIVSPNKGK